MEKIFNGITFSLVENTYYKKSKNCYEYKYKVMFYDEYYDSYRILYRCSNKRDFTLKRIKEEALYKLSLD